MTNPGLVANNLQVFEILQAAARSRSDAKRIAILREHQCLGLLDILKATFDARLKPVVPDTEPPYTPNSQESSPSSLRRNSKYLAYFFGGVKGLPNGTNINKLKREQMYVQFLESLPPEEAALVIGAVAKKLPPEYANVTEDVVRAAFPTILHPQKENA